MSEIWDSSFDRYKAYNSTAYFALSPFGNVATLLLADAGAIKEVGKDPVTFGKPLEIYKVVSVWGPNLIASEHDQWRRHRKIVSPTFSEANNKLVWDQCLRICDEWFEYMDERSVEGAYDSMDVNLDTMRLALMVISSSAFGRDFPWKDEEGSGGRRVSFATALQGLMNEFVMRILLPNWAYYLPVTKIKNCALYYSEFEKYMHEMIQERRSHIASGTENDDLFSSLIKESDKEEGEGALSEGELLSDIYVILLAGHETTGHTLAATLLMLALYPETQKHLHEEAQELIGDDQPLYNNFSALKWSTATLNETLRLFPPIMTIPKRATVDTYLTIHTPTPTQVFIPAGTNVRLDARALHISPFHWGEDAGNFSPERFLDREGYKWDRDAFVPFAVGQRACIGRSFAVVEATVVLSKIMLHYEVVVPASLKKKYELQPGENEEERIRRIYNATHAVTLTPNGFGVSFVKRTSKN